MLPEKAIGKKEEEEDGIAVKPVFSCNFYNDQNNSLVPIDYAG